MKPGRPWSDPPSSSLKAALKLQEQLGEPLVPLALLARRRRRAEALVRRREAALERDRMPCSFLILF